LIRVAHVSSAGFSTPTSLASLPESIIRNRKSWNFLPNTIGRSKCSCCLPIPPDFNAQERLWHYTRKASTRNRYFDRPAELCHSLFTTFADIQKHPEKIQGLLTPFFKA